MRRTRSLRGRNDCSEKAGNRGQIFSISRFIVVLFVEKSGKYGPILPFFAVDQFLPRRLRRCYSPVKGNDSRQPAAIRHYGLKSGMIRAIRSSRILSSPKPSRPISSETALSSASRGTRPMISLETASRPTLRASRRTAPKTSRIDVRL